MIKITPEERSTAVSAARRMGLNVCGVDMLRSNHGPVIIEFIEGNAKAGKTRTEGKG